MPIFSAIGTVIAGALFSGSLLAAKLIAGVIAFGTQLAIRYLLRQRQEKRTYTAVQGETRFGGDLPVGSLFGTGLTKGHQLDYFKWGEGNRYNAFVLALANGRCDGLEPEIYFYGEKFTLVPRATIGNEHQHWGIAGFADHLVSIRFFDGRPGQGVDTSLVTSTAALGRNWKSTSVCAGICYVVFEIAWDADKFARGIPEPEFVLRGLREYDPRKDSTVAGGSGAHRLNDPSTWEYSHNPALHRFNYQLGAVKGLLSGRTMIGEGKSPGQLDLGSYFAAMNVCDELRLDAKKRYQCSLWVSADDDHKEVLDQFDDAMCGYAMNRRGLSGVIAGAPQVPVADLTADDIDLGRRSEIRHRKRAFDLFNTISGQFTSPASHWRPESLKTVTVSADVAADGRVRQTANNFLQVTDPDIAQYCLNVRYRQNRKGGKATVPVSRRFGFRVQEGEWITYLGKTWLITGWRLGQWLRPTLVLAETGADIYDEASIPAGPIVIPPTPPVNPSLLSTVQNFDVAAGMINGANGSDVPTLHFTWTPPNDPTIVAVRFFYGVDDGDGAPIALFDEQSIDPEAGEHFTTKNVVSGKHYVARATITTVPDRLKTFTPWRTTVDPTGDLKITLRNLQEDARAMLAQLSRSIADFRRISERISFDTALGVGRSHQQLAAAVRTQNALAQSFIDFQAEVTDEFTATAQLIAGVVATVDNISADGLLHFQANASPVGGADAQVDMMVRAAQAGVFAQAGLSARVSVIDAVPQSDLLLFADRIFMTDGTGTYSPFTITGGTLFANQMMVNGAKIIDATIGTAKIENAAITNAKIGTAAITNAKIGNLEVDTIKINFSAVGSHTTGSGSGNANSSTWTTIASATINNESGLIPIMQVVLSLSVTSGGGAPKAVQARLINVNTGAQLLAWAVVAGAGGFNSGSFNDVRLDPAASAGALSYAIQILTDGAVGVASGSASLSVSFNKR